MFKPLLHAPLAQGRHPRAHVLPSCFVNPYVAATECLEFESEHAKSLKWLPLAVRYKLDGAGLKLTLQQWNLQSPKGRRDLLRLLPEDGFVIAALNAGAFPAAPADKGSNIDEAEAARILNCTHEQAARWVAASTAFARFALRRGKRTLSP